MVIHARLRTVGTGSVKSRIGGPPGSKVPAWLPDPPARSSLLDLLAAVAVGLAGSTLLGSGPCVHMGELVLISINDSVVGGCARST